jgi:Pyruvate/2-oxoacid:ferredoxin oxidoreductase delta subunit
MAEQEIPMHYVCTHKQAKKLIDNHKRFWVSNCGCREANPNKCQRSRIDVCLSFSEADQASGSDRKEVDRKFARGIMREAEDKNLVTRPWRSEDRTKTDGICFCCDDCCGYFISNDYVCDKGRYIEKTNMQQCTQCGACEEVCYFKARSMNNGDLKIARELCYGCGLCALVCPVECITMIKR